MTLTPENPYQSPNFQVGARLNVISLIIIVIVSLASVDAAHTRPHLLLTHHVIHEFPVSSFDSFYKRKLLGVVDFSELQEF